MNDLMVIGQGLLIVTGVICVGSLGLAVMSGFRMGNHKGDPHAREVWGTRMAVSVFLAVVAGAFGGILAAAL